jgi:hypothetical protein
MVAGVSVPDEDVRELACLVDEPTRSVLQKAIGCHGALTCESDGSCRQASPSS